LFSGFWGNQSGKKRVPLTKLNFLPKEKIQLTPEEMMNAFNNKSSQFHYNPKTHSYTENSSGKIFDGNTGMLLSKNKN